jgi:hypothetical protein
MRAQLSVHKLNKKIQNSEEELYECIEGWMEKD